MPRWVIVGLVVLRTVLAGTLGAVLGTGVALVIANRVGGTPPTTSRRCADGGPLPLRRQRNPTPAAGPCRYGRGVAAQVIRLGTRRRGAWRVAVGSVLREWRTAQGLRLTDVAERAGVSVQYLSEVERGRKEPSSEVLGAVTEALGPSLAELALGVADGLREAPRPGGTQGSVSLLAA